MGILRTEESNAGNTTYYGKDFTRIVLELIGALEQTITVEPLRGWRGAQVNHSLKVLKWLYHQVHLLPW